MSEQNLRLFSPAPAAQAGRSRLPLGRCLVDSGVITPPQLVRALELQQRIRAPLGEILIAEGWAEKPDIMNALAAQSGLQHADLSRQPPVHALFGLACRRFWFDQRVVPWVRMGPMILVATERPDRFEPVRQELARRGLTAVPVLARRADIDHRLAEHYAEGLAAAASNRAPAEMSCRTWTPIAKLPAALGLTAFCLALLAMPLAGFTLLFVTAVITLLLFFGLRLAGFVAHMLSHHSLLAPSTRPSLDLPDRPPCVSMLVPLYREREIAGALVERLSRLTYPKALLDVILVLEAHDDVTRAALARARLPHWMRVIEVPAHRGLTTKPRAMNYALDFCKGDIIGVWDAEDAPLPDQIEHVAARFAHADEDVVCLQGILDYYNPRSNWRARCFTIEYASWFRVVLPGIARLGLVVPLGGTTLFFKRDVLERLGGWDAHNVTEDADLGVRLCRAGYRTELIETVTFEEANFRTWPWVKQRSRWLKGFMKTYLVHMRSPRRLLADLGWARFVGVQAFFLGTLGQFLLAPVLWSFWLILMGLDHPAHAMLPTSAILACAAIFIAAETLNFVVGVVAVSAPQRRFLLPWVLTMPLYFPLGVVAAYKALWELAADPFFWDKTQHGQAGEESAA
ncbi:glycosyltransferase family 2 protein [Lutimaribacter marinistellae]|uniref:Glycosyltransferase family 2 protein n=1 Tax=Lutimaribacter marinistellae TaxID=1820329 RepID=A0ABV7TJ25_9RHOB